MALRCLTAEFGMGSGFMHLARATGPAKDKRVALDFIIASDAGGRVRALRLFRAMGRDARSRFGPSACFYAGLKRRRGRPPTWLSAPWGATRVRACRRFAPVQRSPLMSGSVSEPLSEVKHEVDEGLYGSDVDCWRRRVAPQGRTVAADRSAESLRRGCAAGV